MTELAPDLKRALGHVDTDMDVDRTDMVWKGLVVKKRRRAVRRVAGAAALVMLVGGVALYRSGGTSGSEQAERGGGTTQPVPDPKPPAPVDNTIRLADGSTILPENKATKIKVVDDAATKIAVVVNEGQGTFNVAARTGRSFKVTTSNVRITVYAAEFSVAHAEQKTKVYVERGYIDIEYLGAKGKTLRIKAGERGVFPAEQTASVDPDADKPKAKPAVRRKAPRTPAQRRLAVSDLLKKADAARIAQRPGDAIKPLTRVVREFSSDPRAAMASFTLGRLYLKDLSRPVAAARAFRRVQALSPGGPLAEDALAREVESWAAAGNSANAKARAAVYLKRYPNGHRARAMKNYAE